MIDDDRDFLVGMIILIAVLFIIAVAAVVSYNENKAETSEPPMITIIHGADDVKIYKLKDENNTIYFTKDGKFIVK